MNRFLPLLVLIVVSGCVPMRVAPGHSKVVTSGGAVAEAVQSQDPQAATTQTVDDSSETTETMPGVTAIGDSPAVGVTGPVTASPATSQTNVFQTRVIKHRIIVTTSVGAAQKNMAQEIAAKLASVRWLQWLGLAFIVFGGLSLFYPPLKLVVNSVTTSTFFMAAGGAMIFLPLILVGHEVLIVCLAAGAALVWFLAHRHGSVQGELSSLKTVVGNVTTTISDSLKK